MGEHVYVHGALFFERQWMVEHGLAFFNIQTVTDYCDLFPELMEKSESSNVSFTDEKEGSSEIT